MPAASPDIADRILIARLSLDVDELSKSEDADKKAVAASLPRGITSFDYLVGAWRRCLAQQPHVRKTFSGSTATSAQSMLDSMRGLIVSYLGLVLQEPDMFPASSKPNDSQLAIKTISPLCLVPSILRLSNGAASGSTSFPSAGADASRWATFEQHELPTILLDLARRFEGEGLEDLLGPALSEISRQIAYGPDDGTGSSRLAGPASSPVTTQGGLPNGHNNEALNAAAAAGDVRQVLAHLLGQANNPAAALQQQGLDAPGAGGPSAPRGAGLNIGSMEWTAYVNALYDCTELKPIAAAMTRLDSFNPANVGATAFERNSLLGPVVRLSVFADSSPAICREFFPDSSAHAQIHASNSTLRTTLQTLHGLHFKIFNNLVRSAGPQSREAVLAYWGRACNLNKKRGAMRVRSQEVATDGFMVNLFETVMRFCDPFMDLKYSKVSYKNGVC